MRKRNIWFGSFGILLLFAYLLRFFLSGSVPQDTSQEDQIARRHLSQVLPEILGRDTWDADRLWVYGSDEFRGKWTPEKLKPHFAALQRKHGYLVESSITGGEIRLPDKNGATLRAEYRLECRFTNGPAIIVIHLIPGTRYWAVDNFSVEETTNHNTAKL